MSDHRHFLGEPLHVFGLLGDEVQGNEQGEIAILMAGFLKPAVKFGLNQLPNAVPPWLDHHAAADGRGFGHIRFPDDLLVPFTEIVRPGGIEGAFHSFCSLIIKACWAARL